MFFYVSGYCALVSMFDSESASEELLLGLAPSALSIVRGTSSRDKVVAIVGRSEEEVRAAVLEHL